MASWLAAPVIAGLAVGIAFVLLFSFLPILANPLHERIVFSGLMNGTDTHQIYIVSADGTGLTRLTEDGGLWHLEPVSSPDGSKIAYTTRDSSSNYSPGDRQIIDLYVMDTDGSNKILLTGSDDGFISRHVWSPDSTKIAYESSDDIFIVNVDGTGNTRLTNDGKQTTDVKPVWSSDNSIMFASIVFNETGAVAASWKEVNIDGTGLKTLFDYDYDTEGFHDWSPDMSKISFLRVNDEFSASLYVMNADGSNKTRLADSPPLSFVNREWSPDGQKIAFEHRGSDYDQIYVIDASDGSYANLSNNETDDGFPIWSSDGRQIAFMRGFDDGYQAVVVMNFDGTEQTEVARMKNDNLNVPLDWINE